MIKTKLTFLMITIFYFVITMWVSVFPHEFAHSTTAWFFGFKDNPFNIYYGNFNWQNVLFVTGIDENVNYNAIKLANRPDVVAWTGFAGPAVTILFYLLSFSCLKLQKIKKHPFLYYFLFWINLINLSELTSYIILRSFSTHGDIANLEYGWNITPWYIFIIGGSIILSAIYYMFTRTLNDLYTVMKLDKSLKIVILTLTAFLLFGHPGIRMLLYSYGTFATALGVTFILIMFLILFFSWPSKTSVSSEK